MRLQRFSHLFSEIGVSTQQNLDIPLCRDRNVHLDIKRDDLLHSIISGNKWRKLKHLMLMLESQGKTNIATMGGAYSNLLHSLAYLCYRLNWSIEFFVRGYPEQKLTPTLQDAQKWGMQLHSVSREAYREKHTQPFLDELKQKYPNSMIIAEGGSGVLAVKGVADLMREIESSLPNLDVLVAACGTGGTLAGLVASAEHTKSILGIPVLKGAQFLNHDIEQLLSSSGSSAQCSWQLDLDGHYGGYGKVKAEHITAMQSIEQHHQVLLEPVYVAKMWRRFDELVSQDYFAPGAKVALLHSGGLQGRRGFKALA